MNPYIEQHKDRFLAELFELLRIPSVSADSTKKADVRRAAQFVREQLLKAGADHAELCETAGHPVVYGEKIVDGGLPTVLVYGHYDVQPADPVNLWHSPPFEPQIRPFDKDAQQPDPAKRKGDCIYARGACDDKGQMYMHVKALELMLATGKLPCNVKFMIEGEEEVGSDNLGIFIKQNKEKLHADVILISDTSILSNDCPTITSGLRGLSYLEVAVTGPNRDLHSGVYGGAVANPVNVLCRMIASLKDENNCITIPGFYNNVIELSPEERALMAEIPLDEETYKKDLAIGATEGEAGYSTLERASTRPTLDVNGIWGGYTGEGAKTVLPSKAYAKISMRLVPNQSSHDITELFTRHFQAIAPQSVTVTVTPHHGGEPVVTPVDSVAYQAASKAFEEAWGKTPLPKREGGSIPIVALFEQELGLKSVLMGFGLDSDDLHSPNENFGVFNYLKGIETIPLFYKYYAQSSRYTTP